MQRKGAWYSFGEQRIGQGPRKIHGCLTENSQLGQVKTLTPKLTTLQLRICIVLLFHDAKFGVECADLPCQRHVPGQGLATLHR